MGGGGALVEGLYGLHNHLFMDYYEIHKVVRRVCDHLYYLHTEQLLYSPYWGALVEGLYGLHNGLLLSLSLSHG